MTSSPEQVERTVRVFDWSTVDSRLTMAMLSAAYQVAGQSEEIARLKKLAAPDLATQASRSLGRPLAARHMHAVGDVLLDGWLPTLPARELDMLVQSIQLGLRGAARAAAPRTKPERLAFIREHSRKLIVSRSVRALFISSHKTPRAVSASGRAAREQLSSVIELVGTQAEVLKPYPHQEQAWTALDELASSRKSNRSGLLVLPTGSGKTFTMVRWLLQEMQRRPRMRVLWLADQQELVEQAGLAFRRHAAAMPDGFRRRLRVLHGGAGPASSLADDSLDIACLTRQSLTHAATPTVLTARLRPFLTRPTVVVIDEAHHAVAQTYQNVIETIQQVTLRTVVLGLTATPWPSGQGMHRRLAQLFPETVINVEPLQLIADGILARPVLHTVRTGENVHLDPTELAQIARADVPPSVLTNLNRDSRNTSIVSAWAAGSERWGKSLVFACTIEHADALGKLFEAAGARTLVLHSDSDTGRSAVLREFRDARSPIVLVSVGMLLEGVDIPDARTAVLARPTVSRVVMRQMVGRVLRGPQAGGDAEAHIIAVEDNWIDGGDVLSPVDLRDLERPEIENDNDDGPAYRLPPVLDDRTATPISEHLQRQIERAYQELIGQPHLSVGTVSLVGYLRLTDFSIPVFDHARARWDELIDNTLRGRLLSERSPLDLFDDLAIPRPVKHEVNAVVEFVKAVGARPDFVEVRHTFSVRSIAKDLLNQPAMTETTKIGWQRRQHDTTLARSAYPSFQAFAEALNQEVLTIAGHAATTANPENIDLATSATGLPLIRARQDRLIEPLLKTAAAAGRKLLADAGEHEYRELLDELPAVQWTRRPVQTTYAYWAPRIGGRAKGRPIIRVNLILRAPRSQVPDELLMFLLWHELCHHVLPGRGHDAEFNRLLVMWPDFARLDSELDTLPERYTFDRKASIRR